MNEKDVTEFVDRLLDEWADAELDLVLEVGNSADEANVRAKIEARHVEWSQLRGR